MTKIQLAKLIKIKKNILKDALLQHKKITKSSFTLHSVGLSAIYSVELQLSKLGSYR